MCRCPLRAEGVRTPAARVAGGFEPPTWMLGTSFRSAGVAASALNPVLIGQRKTKGRYSKKCGQAG